ncbi:hypothetical protein R6Q59_004872 [Mikania micrantha]
MIVWHLVSSWCKVQSFFIFSVQDLLEIYLHLQGEHRRKEAFHAVILTSIWCIWKLRNEKIFKGKRAAIPGLLEEIKPLSFLWVKNRARWNELTWEDWCNFVL